MSQSVILLADVPGLGQVGDQKKVKDGFARNYLVPKHLAVFATPNTIKRFERQKEKINAERERLVAKAKELAERVSKVGLVFEKPMGQGGRLFGSVTPLDISSELSRQGATVEKKSILMDGPLRSPGDHKIRVRIHSQVIVDLPVKIVGIETGKSQSTEEETVEEVKADAAPAEAAKEEEKEEK